MTNGQDKEKIIMYINERVQSLVSTPSESEGPIHTISIKKRFIENEDWSYLEKGIGKFLKTLYEQGHLSVKPTNVVVGYEKSDGKFGDDFTIFMLFDK